MYRELEQRVDTGERPSHARDRMHLLVAQAREMTGLAEVELDRRARAAQIRTELASVRHDCRVLVDVVD